MNVSILVYATWDLSGFKLIMSNTKTCLLNAYKTVYVKHITFVFDINLGIVFLE